MNIDPRMLKELLRMQLLNKTNILSTNSSGTGDNESEFSELLNDLLSQNTENSMFNDGAASVTGIQTALKPSSLSPLFASASTYRSGKTTGSPQAAELDPLIQEAGLRHHVQPSLVKAVIDAESSFNSKAVSQAGAKGLMQLMDDTGKSVGVNDPFDPVQNVQGGTKYLSNLLKKYDGNQGVALAAYNAGSGRIDRLGIANDKDLSAKIGQLPKETQAYVAKVMNLQRNYEG